MQHTSLARRVVAVGVATISGSGAGAAFARTNLSPRRLGKLALDAVARMSECHP